MKALTNRYLLSLCLILGYSLIVMSQDFTQENIAKVIVDDIELSNPFGGGLNAPQFSNVDFNNDGLDDVLIFDRFGGVILPMIRNAEGYTYDPSYVENFPTIVNFLLMKDYNDDGIADIFCYSTEPSRPGITVFKGKYTNDRIDFDLFTNPVNGSRALQYELTTDSFANIYVFDKDIPSIEDIDGDGDMDIVTFNSSDGHFDYFQNLVIERGESLDSFNFIKESDCYGGAFSLFGFSQEFALASNKGECSEGFTGNEVTTRHEPGSTLLSIDHDADGDFELLIGGALFNNITLLENGGDKEEAWFNRRIINYPDEEGEPVDIFTFPAAFYVDVDGDDVKDFVAAPNNSLDLYQLFDTNNVWYYKNAGSDNNPLLSLTSKGLFVEDMIDLGTGASPAFADVNADGLIDMVVGTETSFVPSGERDGRLHLFLNIGTEDAPVFELIDRNWLDFQSFNSDAFDFTPTFADLDGDGDMDLYTGEVYGHIYFAENTAGEGQAMTFAPIIPNYLEIDAGQLSAPTFYDLDKDGLLDLIVGERNGNINYYKNIGTESNPNFNPDLESTDNIQKLGQIDIRTLATPFAGYSKPVIIPFNGSDVLVTGTDHGALEMYLIDNDLNAKWDLLDEDLGNIKAGAETIASFVDLDNDGLFEAIIGNERGGLNSYRTDMDNTPVSTGSTVHDDGLNLKSNIVSNMLFTEDDLPAFMKVYTVLGQEVLSHANTSKLDVSHLDTGIYFIQLQRGNVRVTRKFIKQ